MSGGCVGTGSAKDALKEGKSWGVAGGRNGRKKLQKLSFLKLEIMLKMDISRQTKGQNSQTNGAF